MTILEAVDMRRSRRSYTGEPLTAADADALNKIISDINKKGNLNFKLVVNNTAAFEKTRATYGFFSGIKNYIVVAGQSSDNLLVKLGYYGEQIVLEATRLGLGTCWVGGNFDKKSVAVPDGVTLYGAILVGYAKNNKTLKEKVISSALKRKKKTIEEMSEGLENAPLWFAGGMKALQKAPSAINLQPVKVRYKDGTVTASVEGKTRHQSVDLGIAMYHFEIGSGGGTWELRNHGKFEKD